MGNLFSPAKKPVEISPLGNQDIKATIARIKLNDPKAHISTIAMKEDDRYSPTHNIYNSGRYTITYDAITMKTRHIYIG
jgi:hypothetical protein